MSVQRLHHVQLAVPRKLVAAQRRFYGELIGLTVHAEGATEDRLRIGTEGGRIDLVSTDAAGSPTLDAHIALEVDDFRSVRQRLAAAGLAIDETRPLPGYLRLYVVDPAGHRIEILQALPGSELSP
jgi:catechol 2,3-dioxygenase-like lactoylglutathione lyase family enzyme